MTNIDNLIVFLLIIRVIFEIIKEATLMDIYRYYWSVIYRI